MIVSRALVLAWMDLLRPRILGLALIGIALTILLFVVLQSALFWVVRTLVPGDLVLPWIGTLDVGAALSWGTLALFPLMGFFLMAPVAAGFAGLFAERVADVVEELHYPARRGGSLDFLDGLLESVAVVAAILAVAVVSLFLTPVLGPLAPVLLFTANGWLLGREFFQMVARRHLPAEDADRLRQRRPGAVVTLGIGVALLLTVPLLNILVPVLAAAAYTHLFHIVSARRG